MARCRLCRNYSMLWLESKRMHMNRIWRHRIFHCWRQYESADSKGQGIWWWTISETALHEEETDELMECVDPLPYTATSFFDSINRGGLKRPTDFTFQMTSHSWTVYHEIRDNPQMMKGILSARSQSALFLTIMDRATCHSSVSMCGLNNYLCTNGHELTKFVVQRFFNCVAKNLAKEMTSRANPLTEQAAHRRKVNKLCSKSKWP